ncbi:MAG TPA: head GIN domain-containing protein [Pyrinomonadaceae bacterium]|nr:head GIN domain-containing protein [Pyrinomonadaceae bacterium]
MKKILLLMILASLSVGCRQMIHDGVAGSGNRQKEKRTVANFTSISTEGAYDIEFVAQAPLSLEIEGDDNLLPLITTEVSNNVLHIKSKESFTTRKPIALKISAPHLDGISASGAGRIEITGLKNEKFGMDVNGAPGVRVSGETKVLEMEANGAANIDTHKLRADRATVEANGASKVEVYAVNELELDVNGPSRVTYHGNPKVKQDVSGPGSVVKKELTGS